MAKLGPYEVHPFADAFPLVEGEEFDELVQDVKRNGLREPIILSHDRRVLIDGRNRYRACEAAGVDAVFETLGPHYDERRILDLIVSKNLARRHLTPGQRAMVALEYEKAIAAAVKAAESARKAEAVGDRNSHHGDAPSTRTVADLPQSHSVEAAPAPESGQKARDRAAKVVGASGRAVQQAKAVERDAPDLAEKVRRGEMALDAADRERKERLRAMPRPEPAPKPSPVMLTLRTHDGREVSYPKPAGKATFTQQTGEGISWAKWSWNPVTGCLHGCEYCYARAIAARFPGGFPVGFTPLFHEERLDAPASTVIPGQYRDDEHQSCGRGDCQVCAYRRVFVCSMADLYGRWVPDEWITRVHEAMLASPQWQYILLTKFPARYVGLDLPPGAWVGTSVDEQKRVRIAEDAFRKIDGVAVKWLSLEPLREPLEFSDLSMFDWVVIGAQTETRQPDGTVPAFAPPFEWVARLVAQAREAGCKVHLKPNLVNGRPGMTLPDEYPGGA